ncbi:queuosine precursor transporter [Legionella lansingensis]|nr:queuosine precursor transporter [Legionella lansingensis]
MATVCLASKLTIVGNLLLPGGIFAFVFTFAICDIVGEVYGYAYPRLFIWVGVIAEFLFAIVVISVAHMPSPTSFSYPEAYQIVFDPTLRYVVSGLIGLVVGEFINIYLLAKWKIFLKGKFFVLRSLISTAVGQALLTIIVDLLNYIGKISLLELLWMMISGYVWKMCFAVVLAFPSWLIVRWLKKAENVSHYDIHTNFNPFFLSLEHDSGLIEIEPKNQLSSRVATT